MALPAVGQAELLSGELSRAIESVKPNSLALLGCAGGNGLDQIAVQKMSRVICLDINPEFTEELGKRYSRRIPGLECHVGEAETFRSDITVDLVFGALVFEYTRLTEAIESVARLLANEGEFVSLLQLPADGIPTVTPSPYAQALNIVLECFHYVDPQELENLSRRAGMSLVEKRIVTLDSGKSFAVLRMKKGMRESDSKEPSDPVPHPNHASLEGNS